MKSVLYSRNQKNLSFEALLSVMESSQMMAWVFVQRCQNSVKITGFQREFTYTCLIHEFTLIMLVDVVTMVFCDVINDGFGLPGETVEELLEK